MKIYKIKADVNNYQWIVPSNKDDIREKLFFECQPKKANWQPLDMYVFNPKKKEGNFYSLGGIGALVFDEKALDAMLTIFEMAGEILPINVEGTALYILNVLDCVNCLDKEKSTWDYYEDGSRGRILSYAFHANRMTEGSIFKIPETCKTEVMIYSDIKDDEEDFMLLYKRYGLTGMIFEEIFSD